VLVARKTMPANDLRGLIAWLKVNQEKATLGHAGTGGITHITGLFLQRETGTRFQFVPYRGAAPAIQDLVAGQIDLAITDPVVTLPQVRAGTIRAYGITTKTRLVSAADIPTLDEAGLPGFRPVEHKYSAFKRSSERSARWPGSTRRVICGTSSTVSPIIRSIGSRNLPWNWRPTR
jgi:tripartite-type tricarboxylate transporter receptor subunit TctC